MFSQQYLIAEYFPPVWFAPGDEEHLTEPEKKPERKHVAGAYVSPPQVMERHKLHIRKERQRDEDALLMLLS